MIIAAGVLPICARSLSRPEPSRFRSQKENAPRRRPSAGSWRKRNGNGPRGRPPAISARPTPYARAHRAELALSEVDEPPLRQAASRSGNASYGLIRVNTIRLRFLKLGARVIEIESRVHLAF